MSPKSDAFLTAGADGCARLWDVRTNVCCGVVRTGAAPAAAWDHQGLVFGVVTSDGVLKLFDARGYDQGPFDTVAFGQAGPAGAAQRATTRLAFSLDGKQILVKAGDVALVLDAYNGQRLHAFAPPAAPHPPPTQPALTPDARAVLCGGADTHIHVYSAATGAEVAAWRGHTGVPTQTKWSPRRALAASGCTHGGLALWIPQAEGGAQTQPPAPGWC